MSHLRAASSLLLLALAACGSPIVGSSAAVLDPPAPIGPLGRNGGTVDELVFAVIGDTRPPEVNGSSSYPKPIITRIFQDVEARTPRPAFAVGTGDYQYSSAAGGDATTQFGYYLDARNGYSGPFFPTMGNHECTGATISNCGAGNTDGLTEPYNSFVSTLLAPIGQSRPYYTLHVNAADGSWTSKFVFIAANAWDSTQAAWLDQTLSQPTTYTFVVSHEKKGITCPGCAASEAILANHPFTLRLVGHSHELSYTPGSKELTA